MPTAYDIRAVLYNPSGEATGGDPNPDPIKTTNPSGFLRPLETVSITLNSSPDGPTATVVFSRTAITDIPNFAEIGIQYWNSKENKWWEGRDSRFILSMSDEDKKDTSGIVTLTLVNVWQWYFLKAIVKGVNPYEVKNARIIPKLSIKGVRSTGDSLFGDFTDLVGNDRVRIEDRGDMDSKIVRQGATYYARIVSSGEIHLSHTANGSFKKVGDSSGVDEEEVKLSRLRDQVRSVGHKFKDNEAVRVEKADGSALSDDQKYYIRRAGGDTFGFATKRGGVPIELGEEPEEGAPPLPADADLLNVYRDLDGERTWGKGKNKPGQIINDLVDEAHKRGWGPGLTVKFTDEKDSAGNTWDKAVTDGDGDDDTTWGFAPGTPSFNVLAQLAEDGYIEWATLGRELLVFNPDTGADLTVPTLNRQETVRLGGDAEEIPLKQDMSALVSHVWVRGDGPILQEVDGPQTTFGRLESYVHKEGVKTKKHAIQEGKKELRSVQDKQYSLTEDARAANWVPMQHYDRGDKVEMFDRQIGTTRKVVIQEWTIEKNGTDIKVTAVVESRLHHLEHKIKRRLTRITGGVNHKGMSGMKREGSKTVLVGPNQMHVYSSPLFTRKGKGAVAPVTVEWAGVQKGEGGEDAEATNYEVWVRPDGEKEGAVVASTSTRLASVGSYASGTTLGVSVRAQASDGTWGSFSTEEEHIIGDPYAPLYPPTKASVSVQKNGIRVAWDGLVIRGQSADKPAQKMDWVNDSHTFQEANMEVPEGSDTLVDPNAGIVFGSVLQEMFKRNELLWYPLMEKDGYMQLKVNWDDCSSNQASFWIQVDGQQVFITESLRFAGQQIIRLGLSQGGHEIHMFFFSIDPNDGQFRITDTEYGLRGGDKTSSPDKNFRRVGVYKMSELQDT